MFSQQIVATNNLVKCRLLREMCPTIITKVSIYNDSMEPSQEKSKKKVTPVYKPPKIEENLLTTIFGAPNQPKKDWLHDFRSFEFTPVGINKWWEQKKSDIDMMAQEFIEERHQVLGSDLAAATFVVIRGGKVKFKGKDVWVQRKGDGTSDLPTKFDPTYILESLDCSHLQLRYEALHNLQNLSRLKWASFKGDKYFDDWCIDKISSEFHNLECLDVSNCPKVTERGVESLYRLHNLKNLIVTNYQKSDIFELTCLMLEDCLPHLNCTIL